MARPGIRQKNKMGTGEKAAVSVLCLCVVGMGLFKRLDISRPPGESTGP